MKLIHRYRCGNCGFVDLIKDEKEEVLPKIVCDKCKSNASLNKIVAVKTRTGADITRR